MHQDIQERRVIIVINIQPTVKLSSRVELQPLSLVYMGSSGSYLTVKMVHRENSF